MQLAINFTFIPVGQHFITFYLSTRPFVEVFNFKVKVRTLPSWCEVTLHWKSVVG